MFNTIEALHDNITKKGFYPLTHEQAVIGNDEIDLETKLKKINNDISKSVIDYSKEYLTTVALEQGTISFNILKNMGTEYITSISYSTDNGETWTTTNNVNDKEEHLQITVNVNVGDKVMWKGDAQQTGYLDDDYGDYVGSFFSSDCEFDVQGNVMSLLYGDNFKGENTLEYGGQFGYLFYDGENECKVVNARNLSLPATTLVEDCYYVMFYGCTSLATAPELPATTLATRCYSNMFFGCTSLTVAPQLPATTLAQSCYGNMFFGCSSLIVAPQLPATTLASYCYSGMFNDCTNLTTAPQLSATTLAQGCYNNMFSGCTSLIVAPQLPATTLASFCYTNMFNGCTRLNSINCLATNISANNCTTNWVNGVASSGTFIKATNMSRWTSGNNGIPNGWTVYTEEEYEVVRHYEIKQPDWNQTDTTANDYIKNKPIIPTNYVIDYSKEYLTTVALEQGTISFNIWKNIGTEYITSISYSIDNGETWTTTNNTNDKEEHLQITVNVNVGDKVMWKGDAQQLGNSDNDWHSFFSSTARFNVQGNVMSMLYGDDFFGEDTLEYNGQFSRLFSDFDENLECKVVDASKLSLPATTLVNSCYEGMFNGCTSLTTAPQLPATTLANGCYGGMFYGCTSLTTAPELPATMLSDYCYSHMFNGCTSLTTAPQLPATTLANECYSYMFCNCASLTVAPELPATTLADNCYGNMFNGCTSLTVAPQLPATTLTDGCYNSMFYGCSNLSNINCLATNIFAEDCTTDWVDGVASSGTFIKNASMTSWTTGINGIPTGWTVYTEEEYELVRHYEIKQSDWNQIDTTANDYIKNKPIIPTNYVIDYSKEYLTTVALEQGTISFNIWKNMGTDMITSISYSTDNGETWTITNNVDDKEEHLQITVNVNEGDKVLWKGEAQKLGYIYNEYLGSFFSSTARFNVLGNVMSMLYGDDFFGEDTLEYNGQFSRLFSDFGENLECKVVDASKLSLPATTLVNSCYEGMFNGCTSLTTAPQLPATTLANGCYGGMFYGCTSLTTAPQLPATTLTDGCYASMFWDCISLTVAPELPATMLSDYCYASMFQGCTSLTVAPKLPATTLADYCYYYMFDGCTSLTIAPQLPATTLTNDCYNYMFYGCSSLTEAPELPATTLAQGCYSNMFYGCTRLNSINCLATDISASYCTNSWVEGVSASGTFIKAANMSSWTTGVNGIPTNWTVYTEEEYEVVRHYEIKQPDWNQTDTTANDYIKNKPILELSSNYETSSDENNDLRLSSGDSFETAFSKIEKAIIDDELITSSGLNNLSDKKYDKLGGEISGDVKINGSLTLDINDPDYDSGIEFTKSLNTNYGTILSLRGYANSSTNTNYKPIIRNIGTPVQDYDASTKKYVDDHIISPNYYLVMLNQDGSVGQKASTLTYATVYQNLTNNSKEDWLDVSWEINTNEYTRFHVPCVGISEVNNGTLVFSGNIWFNSTLVSATFTLDNQDTLTTSAIIPTPESLINKVQSVVSNSTSEVKYPSTKAVYNEFQRKPDIIYQYVNGDTKFARVARNTNLVESPTWNTLTNKDLSVYKKIKFYVTTAYHSSTTGGGNTAGGICEVDMSDFSKYNNYYSGGTIVTCVDNNNRTLGFTVILNYYNNEWKFAYQLVSLYGTATGDITSDTGYIYKIEGYYD